MPNILSSNQLTIIYNYISNTITNILTPPQPGTKTPLTEPLLEKENNSNKLIG